MVIAVVLQLAAVALWLAGAWLVANWSGVVMAAAIPAFLVGWTLEQRHEAG